MDITTELGNGMFSVFMVSEQNWKRGNSHLNYSDYETAKQKDIKSPLNENEEGYPVVLKSLNNSSNINEDFLNEVSDCLIYFLNKILFMFYLIF